MGRKRRNAYWNAPGGSHSDHNPNEPLNLVKVTPPPKPEPEPEPPVVEQPILITRRSLRQQARKVAKTSYAEDESADNSEEDEELAQFTPLTTETAPRKKRFLKDTLSSKGARKKEDISESTSAVLNRLISKRVSRPGYVVKHGGTNIAKKKIAGTNVLRRVLPNASRHHAPASTSVDQSQESMLEALPLKVEIQEAPTPEGPKKRGRKRKVDILGQSGTFASQPIKSDQEGVPYQQDQAQTDPDWDPNVQLQQQQQRKRGRQSAATANVKNRFPFCSICLSKAPPSDYIINHMSCPTEYQRMKRLFTYIYKDLKFPFLPFDMERENVFDYCDLPLCDCCIQLYREIYDSYCQIEVAKDQLKCRIERMVYQIQLSERNPAVAQQLTSIKNSPDALMNKYCNFRRRFSSYKPGDSRGEVQGGALVPATIARIQIVKETHKRTTGSQTFLTAGHFPPPPLPAPTPAATPVVPVPVPVQQKSTVSASTTDSTKKATSSASSTSTTVPPVVIKKEVDIDSDKTSSVTPTPSRVQNAKPNGNLSSTAKDHKSAPVQKPAATNKVTPSSTSVAPAPTTSTRSSTPATATPAKPVPPPHSSVLTIIKTPGGMGPAIIRKMPMKPAKNIIGVPAKLLAIATGVSCKTGAVSKSTANGPSSSASNQAKPTPEKQSATSIPAVKAPAVKDEPVDVEQAINTDAEEPDPFFSSQLSAETSQANEEKDNDTSTIESEDNSDSQSKSKTDSNVNYKHKKLRVVPVPAYKDSSNDSSDSNLEGKEPDDAGDEVIEKADVDSKSKEADVSKPESTSEETQEDPQSKQVSDSNASPLPSSDGDKK